MCLDFTSSRVKEVLFLSRSLWRTLQAGANGSGSRAIGVSTSNFKLKMSKREKAAKAAFLISNILADLLHASFGSCGLLRASHHVLRLVANSAET
jgi:hypothetical protein